MHKKGDLKKTRGEAMRMLCDSFTYSHNKYMYLEWICETNKYLKKYHIIKARQEHQDL